MILTLASVEDPTKTYQQTASRSGSGPSQQTISFPGPLRVGAYRLSAEAFAGDNGSGAKVASGSVDVAVTLNQTAKPGLTLSSALRSLEINAIADVAVSKTATLTATARDADGAAALLPPASLLWKQLSGETLGTLTTSGIFRAKRVPSGGAVRVRVEETKANLSAEAQFTVLPAPPLPKNVLAMFMYDLRHTSRSSRVATATGKLKWKSPVGDGFWASPVIAPDGMVFANAFDGNMYALDGATGAKKWQFSSNNYHSTASIGPDGTLYFGGGKDGMVYALDSATGAKKWAIATGGPDVNSSPALAADGTLYIGTGTYSDTRGLILALDGATGAIKWKFDAGSGVEGSPALSDDGTLYIGTLGNKLYALNSQTGAKIWEASGDGGASYFGAFESSPSIGDDGTIYLGSRAGNGGLYAFDGKTGARKWKFAAYDVRGCPALGLDGTLYFPSSDDNLYALNPDGSLKWKLLTNGQVKSTPAIDANGTLYFGSKDGNLRAVDPATGQTKWSYQADDYVFCTPAIGDDGTLYITDFSGAISAVG